MTTTWKQGLLALLLLISSGGIAPAQSGSPINTGPTPDPDPVAVPLDGGTSLLLAGGVAYGLRRLRARQRA
jgi:hypothetical protein